MEVVSLADDGMLAFFLAVVLKIKLRGLASTLAIMTRGKKYGVFGPLG